jgi:hypothetical protein
MNSASAYAMSRKKVTPHERAMRSAAARAGKNREKGKGHPVTSDMDYSAKEIEFMSAVQAFKTATGRQFPTWREVLRVIESLGYSKDGAE